LTSFTFYEDCPYQDESAELLRLAGRGNMRLLTRENGTCACAGDLAEYYERKGLKVRNYLRDGEAFKPGDTILEAEGDLKLLFKFWRVSQTFLSIMCAIATKTASFMSAGRKANPDLYYCNKRKPHPGSRIFELKSRPGRRRRYPQKFPQATPSQLSQNHLEVAGELGTLRELPEQQIEIEPRSREEACQQYAEMADINCSCIPFSGGASGTRARTEDNSIQNLNLQSEGIKRKRFLNTLLLLTLSCISAPY